MGKGVDRMNTEIAGYSRHHMGKLAVSRKYKASQKQLQLIGRNQSCCGFPLK